ncbi:hypothetical protein AAE478_009194 [Parahypoxylon ruwenzoriense]
MASLSGERALQEPEGLKEGALTDIGTRLPPPDVEKQEQIEQLKEELSPRDIDSRK